MKPRRIRWGYRGAIPRGCRAAMTRRRRRRGDHETTRRRPATATAAAIWRNGDDADDDDAMTMRRRRDDATTTRRRQRDAGSRCRTGASLVHDPTRECAGDGCTTGARQGACQGARRQGARQGTTRRHAAWAARRGAAQTCTRHDTTFQSGANEREENTRAEGHGDVFGSGAGAIPTRAKVTRRRRPRGGMRRRASAMFCPNWPGLPPSCLPKPSTSCSLQAPSKSLQAKPPIRVAFTACSPLHKSHSRCHPGGHPRLPPSLQPPHTLTVTAVQARPIPHMPSHLLPNVQLPSLPSLQHSHCTPHFRQPKSLSIVGTTWAGDCWDDDVGVGTTMWGRRRGDDDVGTTTTTTMRRRAAATSAGVAGASQLHHRCIKQGGASARDQVQDR